MENLVKTWYGIDRKDIEWHPTIDEDLCMGCGLCVIGCAPMVYRYDYERRKPVVFAPLNCLVGCMTCGITCPRRAVSFPTLTSVHRFIHSHNLMEKSKEELNRNKEKYRTHGSPKGENFNAPS